MHFAVHSAKSQMQLAPRREANVHFQLSQAAEFQDVSRRIAASLRASFSLRLAVSIFEAA
jgi:hypothetical protein